jgi:hypothetical protein
MLGRPADNLEELRMDSEVESPVDNLEAIEEMDDTQLGDADSHSVTGRIIRQTDVVAQQC